MRASKFPLGIRRAPLRERTYDSAIAQEPARGALSYARDAVC